MNYQLIMIDIGNISFEMTIFMISPTHLPSISFNQHDLI